MKRNNKRTCQVSVDTMLGMRERKFPTLINPRNGHCFVLKKHLNRYRFMLMQERVKQREAEKTFMLCL